ncbi:MAG: heparinase II/III family protein [Bacillus subtilis]|nr:heparinase II/III family protein [Bacillus subtilis]
MVQLGLAVLGMLTSDAEMTDFAMNGPYGLTEQLLRGVTPDGFWFEGSIHYHFFTVEAMMQTFVFAKVHQYPLSSLFRRHIKKMLKSAYDYAFSSFALPNPNDGWPNINLKTYGYLYEMAVFCYGEISELATLAKAILTAPIVRTDLPLTKPYYFDQRISLERLTLIPRFVLDDQPKPAQKSHNYRESQFAILRNDTVNAFFKYGHNGPSHAHPDKMSVEVMFGDTYLTRDLSERRIRRRPVQRMAPRHRFAFDRCRQRYEPNLDAPWPNHPLSERLFARRREGCLPRSGSRHRSDAQKHQSRRSASVFDALSRI